jgi:hypothetical protein
MIATLKGLLQDPLVYKAISDHYRQSIAKAVSNYVSHCADEDSVSGALGERLTGEGSLTIQEYSNGPDSKESDAGSTLKSFKRNPPATMIEDGRMISTESGMIVTWKSRYQKLRGRGRGAPEKKLGIDGLIEIVVGGLDSRTEQWSKVLVFQAKNLGLTNSGNNKSRAILRQSEKILKLPVAGVFVVYRPSGYMALSANAVARSEGALNGGCPLEDMLANQFLECSIGTTGFTYDARKQEFIETRVGGELGAPVSASVDARFKTEINIRPWSL